MRKTTCCLLAALALGLAPAARAELCTIDAVPAATLLLPYFEIDLSKRKSEDWVFTINNGGAAPTIAHVSLWTDLSVPTFAFDVFLTGFDTQTISLKELFFNGFVPAEPPYAGVQTRQELVDAHTGKSVDGECYGRSSGQKARGYVTIDNAAAASVIFPNDSGYFDDVATNTNALWGQYYVIKGGYISAENLTHVETNTNSGYTFYGRVNNFNGDDDREPLGEQWAARYFANGRNKTYLIVWRDSAVDQGPTSCDGLDGGWYPLGETEIIAFNEQEDSVELTFDENHPFPAETQEVRIGSSALPVPFDSGWMALDLRTDAGLQSFVTVRQDVKKRRSHHMANQLFFSITGSTPRTSSACGSPPRQTAGPIP